MSDSLKIGSEETVTSQFCIPAIDLCFDDEIHVDLAAGNSREKCKSVHMLEAPGSEENCMKKCKVTRPIKSALDTVKEGLIISVVKIKCGGIAHPKKKGNVEDCPQEVIVLDTSDESSD